MPTHKQDAARIRELEDRAAALVEYGNSLPDGVTTEAFAEASLLRDEARKLRAAEGVAARRRNLLDSAAEVYSIAAHYEAEGDPELMRRVKARIVSSCLTVEEVEQRVRDRGTALASEMKA